MSLADYFRGQGWNGIIVYLKGIIMYCIVEIILSEGKEKET